MSKQFDFDAPAVEESQATIKPADEVSITPAKPAAPVEDSQRTIDIAPITLEIGGRGYTIDYAGQGTAEVFWDFYIAQARLLQLPDLLSGEWINSGGHYDRQKGEWFNTKGTKGIPIGVLRDVIAGRIMELGLDGDTVFRYLTRRGRTIAEEQAFLRLDFDARMHALRTGAAR